MQSDEGFVQVGHSQDLTWVLARYQTWRTDAEKYGFYPSSVGLVVLEAGWAVEVPQRLMERSLSEVWP